MASSEPIPHELVSTPAAANVHIQPLPPLNPGDHLDQPTFHARYEAMPEGFRAELIEGIVIVPSPIKSKHSRPDGLVHCWLATFRAATPGTEFHPNFTVILGPRSEPEPDSGLLILPACGGQTREEDDYIVGAPELLAEVCNTSEAQDLHSKRRDYERAGVKEYVIVVVRERRVVWLVLRDGRFTTLEPDHDGIIRSTVFPGLWLDPVALLENNWDRVIEVVRQGLQSPEHAAFVDRLQAERKRRSGESGHP
ncbi:MAG: Uma2 family endonuclease [Planctomycetes bacterium]|nr:Uma2 family endonuclease [Planctomycetota bacterium]